MRKCRLDIANAGSNYYTGVNIPNYPVGVVVTNNVVASGGDCRSGTPLQYSTNCFDTISIITADKNTAPDNPMSSSSGCIDTSAATSGAERNCVPVTLRQRQRIRDRWLRAGSRNDRRGELSIGDQILFVKTDGSQYTTRETGVRRRDRESRYQLVRRD